MVTLIMVLLLRDAGQVEGVFPVVGVFAFSSVRLLPALQQIFHGAASIRASHAVLDRVHADLTAPAPPPANGGALAGGLDAGADADPKDRAARCELYL